MQRRNVPEPRAQLLLVRQIERQTNPPARVQLTYWTNVHRLTAATSETGRVYAVDDNALFNRSGPRLVDSLEILAHLLHPEWFDVPAWCGEAKRQWREIQLVAAD